MYLTTSRIFTVHQQEIRLRLVELQQQVVFTHQCLNHNRHERLDSSNVISRLMSVQLNGRDARYLNDALNLTHLGISKHSDRQHFPWKMSNDVGDTMGIDVAW